MAFGMAEDRLEDRALVAEAERVLSGVRRHGLAVGEVSMEIEVLNNFKGDKLLKVDTGTAEGRKKAADVLGRLFKSGTAIFLERADKTYRVTGYDPKTDRLLVGVHNKRITGARCACVDCRGCDNNIASNNRSGICTACQQGRHGGRAKRAWARQGRRDRLTAVAPVSGGTGERRICDGCNVREPFEHRCHGSQATVRGERTGLPCECSECDEIAGPFPRSAPSSEQVQS